MTDDIVTRREKTYTKQYIIAECVGGQNDGKLLLVKADSHDVVLPIVLDVVSKPSEKDLMRPLMATERFRCGKARTVITLTELEAERIEKDNMVMNEFIDYCHRTNKSTRFYVEGLDRNDPVDDRKIDLFLLNGSLRAMNYD